MRDSHTTSNDTSAIKKRFNPLAGQVLPQRGEHMKQFIERLQPCSRLQMVADIQRVWSEGTSS
jgi:hypothetical protein